MPIRWDWTTSSDTDEAQTIPGIRELERRGYKTDLTLRTFDKTILRNNGTQAWKISVTPMPRTDIYSFFTSVTNQIGNGKQNWQCWMPNLARNWRIYRSFRSLGFCANWTKLKWTEERKAKFATVIHIWCFQSGMSHSQPLKITPENLVLFS